MTILNYIKDKSLSIFILFITVIISYSFMLAVNIESHSAIFIEMILIIHYSIFSFL